MNVLHMFGINFILLSLVTSYCYNSQ